jgi:hypothetical protein
MKVLLRTQMELFASPARSPELLSSERQKAITLLRALLMEAVINQSSVPASGGEREPGHE